MAESNIEELDLFKFNVAAAYVILIEYYELA